MKYHLKGGKCAASLTTVSTNGTKTMNANAVDPICIVTSCGRHSQISQYLLLQQQQNLDAREFICYLNWFGGCG